MQQVLNRTLEVVAPPIKTVVRKLPAPMKDRFKRSFPELTRLAGSRPAPQKAGKSSPNTKKSTQAGKTSTGKTPDVLSGSYTNRISVQDMVNRLQSADAISFDIFDTLIVRPFRDPREIFSILEIELDHPGFRGHRIRAEKEARDVAREASGGKSHEVTLREIYEHMHRIDGIDVKSGMEAEIRTEMRYVRPNSYMLEVLHSLRASGKEIALTSDMYMSEMQIRRLLNAAGIELDVPIFVSSEYGVSKRNGGLYDIVRAHFAEKIGKGAECAHIGDNVTVDVRTARDRGWTSHFYQNIHSFITPAWTVNGQMLRGSAIQGLIDVKFGNVTEATGGLIDNYALGYRYAGPMTLAFVDWIVQRARELELDQLVFLSRDGYLPHAVYQLVGATVPSVYLPWSRAIGLSTGARTFKGEWIRQFVARADEAGFETADDLLDALGVAFDPQLIQEYLPAQKSDLNRLRTQRDEERPIDTAALERLFQEHWGVALPQIEESMQSTREAVQKLVIGHRVGIVDIGWAGTGVLTLRSVLRGREVRGFHFGAFRHQRFAPLLEDGVIENFVFGSNHNFAVRNAHAKRPLFNNTLMEVLMGAPYPSVARLVSDDDDIAIELGLDAPEEHAATRRIIAGAIDFVTDYLSTFKDGPQLRDISDGTIGELYLDLERNHLIRGSLEQEFPSKFHGVPVIRKARRA